MRNLHNLEKCYHIVPCHSIKWIFTEWKKRGQVPYPLFWQESHCAQRQSVMTPCPHMTTFIWLNHTLAAATSALCVCILKQVFSRVHTSLPAISPHLVDSGFQVNIYFMPCQLVWKEENVNKKQMKVASVIKRHFPNFHIIRWYIWRHELA